MPIPTHSSGFLSSFCLHLLVFTNMHGLVGVLNTISTVTLTLQCIHVCELSSWSREERLFSWLFIMQLYWYIGMLLIYVLQSSIFALFTASTGALAECSGFAQVGQYSEPCSLRTAWLRNLHKAIDPVDGN